MKAKPGIHYKAVDSELARERTGEVLSALNRREILQVLETNPIENIAIRRTGDKQISGEYDWRRRTIVLNAARKMGIHYGADFRPGSSYSMSSATSDRMDSLRRSLLQETAHHVENSLVGVSEIVRALLQIWPNRRSPSMLEPVPRNTLRSHLWRSWSILRRLQPTTRSGVKWWSGPLL
jgi:hypothetical protein